jgi:hypothetical protein
MKLDLRKEKEVEEETIPGGVPPAADLAAANLEAGK